MGNLQEAALTDCFVDSTLICWYSTILIARGKPVNLKFNVRQKVAIKHGLRNIVLGGDVELQVVVKTCS